MILRGTSFGDIDYAEDDLIRLGEGLVGMPGQTRFLVLDFEGETPFKWLQSVDDAGIGFLITEPALFRPEYALTLEPQDLQDLQAESTEELVVFVLCTYRGDLRETTGNLLGPVIVNARTRRGRQVVLERAPYGTAETLAVFRGGDEGGPQPQEESIARGG
jgi:flagellar assembly factor FliW